MRLLEDLRFIIGLFFLITGVLLLAQGFSTGPLTLSPANLNLGAGLAMTIFAVAMMGASLAVRRKSSTNSSGQ